MAHATESHSLWSPCGEAPRLPGTHERPARPQWAEQPEPPHRPLTIALHASASSAGQWRTLAERLEPTHRLLAVDLHNHGAGPDWPGPTPLTLEDEAALVAPLLAAAGTVATGGGAHLVGHSYGGAVALKAAGQHPQHVRSLTLYEPVAFRLLMDDPASHAEAQESLAVGERVQTHLERDDFEGAAQHFVDYWSGSGAWAAMAAAARAAVAARMPTVLLHFGALFNERQQTATLARLARARLPTLVLAGERTVATTRRIARRVRELLPGATHETLPCLGHMGPLTHARFVAERIAAFVRQGPRGPMPAPQWPLPFPPLGQGATLFPPR